MLIFKQATTLQHFLKHIHRNPSVTGFIPTMGALHEGHISLIKAAQQKQYYTVCSIFVNPTQFNNREDFEKYPISVENDIEQLLAAGCDVLFLPSVDAVYGAARAVAVKAAAPNPVGDGAYQTGSRRPGHEQPQPQTR